ncbi:MAG: ribosome recycling factor [Caldimicrobium sp.]
MKEALEDLKKKMQKTIQNLKEKLSYIRTSKASISLLEGIKVDCYGQKMSIPQIASINIIEGKILIIQPWDPSLIKEIEKAIQKSDLGINPTSDGKTIKLVFPPLTEEKRKELVKVAQKIGEEAKIAIRNLRRDILEKFKTAKKNKEISEDEYIKLDKEVQKIHDEFIKSIEKILAEKEKEILTP